VYDQINNTVGCSVNDVRQEVDHAYRSMREYYLMQPDEIMQSCSMHSARLSELRTRIRRIEDLQRQWEPVRIKELEPVLSDLQYQYTIASRLHSVREFDWRMETGGV
jgi:DNA repair ATPase RecN